MDGRLDEYATWVRRPTLPAQPTEPTSSYFICATPRSGSWLLCGLLASSGVAGRPHEWFLEPVEAANASAWATTGFAEYVRFVRDAATTPNGVCSAKVMWAYHEQLLARLRDIGDADDDAALIARHFPSPRFIWTRRDDLEAQAVSWAKAIQTGYWHHWDMRDTSTGPAYDGGQIDALARAASADNASWQGWFSDNGIELLTVVFEELVADPAGVAGSLLEALDIPAPGAQLRALTTSTRDATTAEWLRRRRP